MLQPMAREQRFDLSPSCGKVGIARRHRPNGVEMIGVQDDCVQGEWPIATDALNCVSQSFSCQWGRQNRTPVMRNHREEERAALNVIAAVVCHGDGWETVKMGASTPSYSFTSTKSTLDLAGLHNPQALALQTVCNKSDRPGGHVLKIFPRMAARGGF